ncbi:MAG: hypothetical protein JW950_10670, partial [Deltaproteobacteria bacterium]|nr:hypothetical protein [Deltaproteobacteria bacterium]
MKKLWILAGIVSFSLGIILIAGCTKKTLWMTEGAVSVEQSAEMTSGMEHKTAGTGVTQDTGTVMAGPESSEGVQGKPANGRLAADDA